MHGWAGAPPAAPLAHAPTSTTHVNTLALQLSPAAPIYYYVLTAVTLSFSLLCDSGGGG